jgi:SEC-C motif-containing protein
LSHSSSLRSWQYFTPVYNGTKHLGREDYLLATWYHSTRPASLELAREPRRKWLGLEVRRRTEPLGPDNAVVEFVARYKVNGRAHRLHEISRFVREAGKWLYVDGDIV